MLSFNAEDLESVVACLGDDAAALSEGNPEDECAANMLEAVRMLEEFQKAREELLARCEDSDDSFYGTLGTRFVREVLR